MTELSDLAAEAYVYGYPLVFDLSMVSTALHKGFGSLPSAAFNEFAHSSRLATPEAHFVSVNNDTVYSVAQLDLSGGPVLLHVPDTLGAYYVLQFIDAWSNNFAYVGRRATGTGEGKWLIVPPGWAGEVPDEVTGVIDAPTSVVTIAGRQACDGPADLPRVHGLQQRLHLKVLEAVMHRTGLPAIDHEVPPTLQFFEKLRVWMAAFPPSADDRAYQDRFQPAGGAGGGTVAVRPARPGAGTRARRGTEAGHRVRRAGEPARRGRQPDAGGVGDEPASLRLQPRLVRGGHDRLPGVADRRPRGVVPDQGGRGPDRAVGQPRLRSGLRPHLRGRRRPVAQRLQELHAALRPACRPCGPSGR